MSEFKKYRRKGLSEMRSYEAGEDVSKVSISQPDKDNGSPKDGDMIARNPKNYDDQWLVAKQYFEDNLEEVTDEPNHNMNFGWAITQLKAGKKVCRIGWNGIGMYLYHVPAASYPAITEAAKKEFGDTVPYTAYVAIKTVQGNVSVWQPSNNDMLSEDWMIVE